MTGYNRQLLLQDAHGAVTPRNLLERLDLERLDITRGPLFL